MSKTGKRTDQNHSLVVDALRANGWRVLSLAPLGNGAPDLLCAKGLTLRLVEVKGEKGTLTPKQAVFHELWPVTILRTAQDALELT